MACRVLQKVCKTESEVKRYGFDYAGYDAESGSWGFLVRTWSPGTVFPSPIKVRPSLPTGLQYSSAGGQSGQTEPRWPGTVGGTVTDGSVTWTAEAISNDSLKATIVTSAWATDDSGITADNGALTNTNGAQIVAVDVSDGTSGQTYFVTNTVTLSDGTVEQSALEVAIS
jgi:hypothetical protein